MNRYEQQTRFSCTESTSHRPCPSRICLLHVHMKLGVYIRIPDGTQRTITHTGAYTTKGQPRKPRGPVGGENSTLPSLTYASPPSLFPPHSTFSIPAPCPRCPSRTRTRSPPFSLSHYIHAFLPAGVTMVIFFFQTLSNTRAVRRQCITTEKSYIRITTL